MVYNTLSGSVESISPASNLNHTGSTRLLKSAPQTTYFLFNSVELCHVSIIPNSVSRKKIAGGFFVGVVIVLFVVINLICWKRIPAGYAGVIYNMNGGALLPSSEQPCESPRQD